MASNAAETVETALEQGSGAVFSYWWVGPSVLAVSVLVAIIMGSLAIWSNWQIARRRATLDLIERLESTAFYQDATRAFLGFAKSEEGFEPIFDPKNPAMIDQRLKVLNYINHYELIAIGCEKRVLDEDFYYDYMAGVVIRDWDDVKPFVIHLRTPSPDSGPKGETREVFVRFEQMAARWKRRKARGG